MVINWGQKSVKIHNTPPRHCLTCGEVRSFSIRLQYGYFGLLCIFLTSWPKKYIYCCDVCEHGYELPEDIQENIEKAVQELGKSPIPWFSRYGLWIFLAVVMVLGAVSSHQDGERRDVELARTETELAPREAEFERPEADRVRAQKIVDAARTVAVRKLFAYWDTKIPDASGTGTLLPLSKDGIETLQSFHADLSKYDDVGLLNRVRAFTTVTEKNKISGEFSIVPFNPLHITPNKSLDWPRKIYANDDGAEILLLYKAFRIMDASKLEEFTTLIDWPNIEYNARGCFYIYDNLMNEEDMRRAPIRKRY